MIVERILEAIVITIAIRTGMRAAGLPTAGGGHATWRWIIQQRTPVAAIVLTSLLVAGAVLQLCWPGALDTLSRSSSGGHWWQVLTAPFVQDGPAGAVFNIVTATIVLALAQWLLGGVAAAIWLLGAWAPVSAAAGLAGYHVSASNVAAYSAGSSGATYFTAGAICAAFVITSAGRTRWLGLVAPAVAVVMWAATNDGHGVLLTEGFVAGLLLCGLWLLMRRRSSAPVRPGGHRAVLCRVCS